MLKINNIKAYKQDKELEIVTKTNRLIFRSPNHGGHPTKLSLKVIHPKVSQFSSKRILHQGTNTLTSSESPHLHQIQ